MITLPISRLCTRWRPSNGHDDIALADSPPGLAGTVKWLSVCVDVDVARLPVGDLDWLIVGHRRELRGDSLVAEGSCDRCAAIIDLQLSIADYAAYHRPRPSRSAVPGSDGWLTLRHMPDVSFRIPAVADVVSSLESDVPRAALLRSCTRGPVTARAARAVETALARLAPTLRADVSGTCPECSASVVFDLDARELCMAELRFVAASVYDDVNLIASMYHWSDTAILDLPSARRRCYADMIAGRHHSQLGVAVA
ncbi:hypothetical protein [Mycobacterium sp. 050134]|uniref:hypothetical protein n=1 Tax=Mycobacterium sp. 050134 TaxID=3096111 RepID=UPI002ED8CE6C